MKYDNLVSYSSSKNGFAQADDAAVGITTVSCKPKTKKEVTDLRGIDASGISRVLEHGGRCAVGIQAPHVMLQLQKCGRGRALNRAYTRRFSHELNLLHDTIQKHEVLTDCDKHRGSAKLAQSSNVLNTKHVCLSCDSLLGERHAPHTRSCVALRTRPARCAVITIPRT